MRTNIVLNDELVRQAFFVAPSYKTKKELIDAALREFVQVRKSKGIKELQGMNLFSENYDYKSMREGK